MTNSRTVVVTGASSGIGAATASAFARDGYRVIAGARGLRRLREVVEPIGAEALELDVTSTDSVRRFADSIPAVDVLVNNAGLALGVDPVAEFFDDDWRTMFETNVFGVGRLTRALLPKLIAAEAGQIINVTSTSAFETYPGGAGYCGSKHAVRAVTRALRQELIDTQVRVSEVCPGMADTEFSLVRFAGDREQANGVYRGMTPLAAEDVAEAVVWVASRPAHVAVDELVIRPRDQVSSLEIRRSDAVRQA